MIDFCNCFYNYPGLSFMDGRAEKIPVENESYDAVVNVESAILCQYFFSRGSHGSE